MTEYCTGQRQDKDLYFLCNKIIQLRTAIFTNFSTALLKFPVNVVEVSTIDNDGNLWFMLKKPYLCIQDFEQTFPAQLHFYNKHFNYRITAHGKACIADDDSATASAIAADTETRTNYAIIKFEIQNAEYFYDKSISTGLIDFINKKFNKLLLNEEAVSYRF